MQFGMLWWTCLIIDESHLMNVSSKCGNRDRNRTRRENWTKWRPVDVKKYPGHTPQKGDCAEKKPGRMVTLPYMFQPVGTRNIVLVHS